MKETAAKTVALEHYAAKTAGQKVRCACKERFDSPRQHAQHLAEVAMEHARTLAAAAVVADMNHDAVRNATLATAARLITGQQQPAGEGERTPDIAETTGHDPGLIERSPLRDIMSLADLLDHLKRLPATAHIGGLSANFCSYRGYYEHLAIEPGPGVAAGDLLVALGSQVGQSMTGWKGGTFPIDGSCLVFVAYEGETGPKLAGFNGTEPILAKDTW